jgi:hypothetical protein
MADSREEAVVVDEEGAGRLMAKAGSTAHSRKQEASGRLLMSLTESRSPQKEFRSGTF